MKKRLLILGQCFFSMFDSYEDILYKLWIWGQLASLLHSKKLPRRLRTVLGNTISKSQGAFIDGRNALDVALIEMEEVEYRCWDKEGVTSKVDFEKTYDCVDWGFLDFVLDKSLVRNGGSGCRVALHLLNYWLL